MKKTLLSIVVCVCCAAASANATVLIQDSFPTNGNLVGTTPLIGGIWTQIGTGTPTPLEVLNNQLLIKDENSQDAFSAFGAVQNSDVFASFILNFSSLDAPNSANGDYFAAFDSNTSTQQGGYSGKLFSVKLGGTPTGQYQLAVGNGGDATTGAVFWGANLSVDTSYLVVMKFTQSAANDTVTLWINPADSSSTSVTTAGSALASSLAAFAFRQSGNTGDAALDDLKVGTTFGDVAPIPEPSTVALIGLGLGAVIFGARRRRA